MMLKGWVGCTHLCPQCAFVSLVYLSHLYGCLFKFLYISQGFDFYMFLKVLKQVWHLSGLPLHLSLSHKLAGFWLACGECHKRLYGVFTAPHSYLHLSTKRTITTHGHGVHASTVSAPFFFKLFIFFGYVCVLIFYELLTVLKGYWFGVEIYMTMQILHSHLCAFPHLENHCSMF